jgi:NodT family efflux transporter outer membrane factor (OMF) lipoprotein
MQTLRHLPRSIPAASCTSWARGASLAGSVTLLIAISLPGCLVGPDYVRPEQPLPNEQPIPDAWHQATVEDFQQTESPVRVWWQTFDDDKLVELIARAEQANLDLQQAVARIMEARALVGVATGEQYPQVEATADYTLGAASDAILPDAETVGVLAGGFAMNWEIDVFGGIRRNIESAQAGFEASVEDYRDVMVSLFAEVAASYVDVRAFQLRIEYASQNIELQRESLQLTRDRFNAGLTSALDVAQAESNLASTEATIPQLEAALEFALNRLAILLATPPGTLHEELGQAAEVPVPPDTIAVGLPAELLRQRADIRSAERALAAQTAQIGVATSELYPKFSLAGLLTFDVAGPGDGSGVSWSIIPGMRWNIFNAGRVRSQIRVEEARTERLFLAYEQTVLVALEEVENSLVAYKKEEARQLKLREAVDASQRAVELVRTQYLAGLTNFQNVLDSQRTLFQLEDQLAESEGLLSQNLVFVYRSLGGGWAPISGDMADEEVGPQQ